MTFWFQNDRVLLQGIKIVIYNPNHLSNYLLYI